MKFYLSSKQGKSARLKTSATLVLAGFILVGLVTSIGIYTVWGNTMTDKHATRTSNNWRENKFVNTSIDYSTNFKNIWEVGKAFFTTKRQTPLPKKALPVQSITREEILNEKNDVVYRLGHSSLLMKVSEKIILADPVFSERASPFETMGPKRFHQSPISIAELPDVDAVIISHDHYDHLDKKSIRLLDKKVKRYFVPLGVGTTLQAWGISTTKVVELDWWQTQSINNIDITATPAQHFSGRGLFDRDKTLWASWVIRSPETKLFFSGDSGYFDGFKQIGERYGPFDLTMIETGAYNELWSDIHMLPEQSVQAHIDLKGKAMLPVHNSTFDLALHDWYEPLERATSAANQNNVKLLTPVMGEKIEIHAPANYRAWWREQVEEEKHSQFALTKLIPANNN